MKVLSKKMNDARFSEVKNYAEFESLNAFYVESGEPADDLYLDPEDELDYLAELEAIAERETEKQADIQARKDDVKTKTNTAKKLNDLKAKHKTSEF